MPETTFDTTVDHATKYERNFNLDPKSKKELTDIKSTKKKLEGLDVVSDESDNGKPLGKKLKTELRS